MSQIAQQDNLVIVVSTAMAALKADVKTKLINCIKGGTITDVVLVSTEAANKQNYGKVLGYLIDSTTANAPKYSIAVMDVNGAKVSVIALN